MNCTEFENQIERLFRQVEAEPFLAAFAAGCNQFDGIQDSSAREHLAGCPACAVTFIRYLRLRDRVRMEEHPCLHLALEAAEGSFIEMRRGYYLIHGQPSESEPRFTQRWQMGKFISHCPWCGIRVLKIYDGNLDDLYG